MTKEEFCLRFVKRMIEVGGEKFDDGTSIREYAEDVAPTYWDEPFQREEGPEECADADMSYWGED
jgi:hypothetical protein